MGVLSDRKNRPHRTKINYPREPLAAPMTTPTLAQVLAAGADGGGHNATGIAILDATAITATTIVTNLNTLDDGAGNGYFAGTLGTSNTTLDDGGGNAFFSGSLKTTNNTLDNGAGNALIAGVLNTTNTVLDDGAGNATFNGAVQAAQFNAPSYSVISNMSAIQLGVYGSVITPHEGMISYDYTLHKLKVYTNSGWQTVTSA